MTYQHIIPNKRLAFYFNFVWAFVERQSERISQRQAKTDGTRVKRTLSNFTWYSFHCLSIDFLKTFTFTPFMQIEAPIACVQARSRFNFYVHHWIIYQ